MKRDNQILSLLNDSSFEECRVIKKVGNTTMMTGTSTKIGKLTDKNILEAIHDYPYQNIMLAIDNSKVVYLKQEKKFKI